MSLPEYGFSSKILSASKLKKKKFVPTTPAKKNHKGQHKYGKSHGNANRFGITHNEGRYATEVKGIATTTVGSGYHENYDLYSPIAYVLRFYEEVQENGESVMKVDSIPTKHGRF